MGLFDWLKNRRTEMKYAKMLNGYAPIFSQFGSDIYASDVVQQAINCIVRETKKLMPKHIRTADGKVVMVSGNIQNVLDNPNPLMTTSDFIEKIIWNLFFNYNSFVLPMWENDKLVALYPLQPTFVDFLQDASSEYFVRMRFNNGYEGTVRYSDLIHIKFNYSVNEFMGGNESGQPDNAALLKSLDLNNTLLEGVAKALKSSFSINGVVKYNTLIDGQKTEAALQELTEALRRNESGFMPLDLKGEFIPFNRQIQMVDSTTLKFIDEKILRHFGVPLPILTGDYTKAQYEAFFQKTIEPLIVSMNQAFTKALFTNRESSGFGNSIVFYYNKLNFMTVGETIEFVKISASAGAIRIDEIRAAFGYPPCEDQEIGNMFVMSKNYGSVESVKNMDLNAVGGVQNENQESDP